MVPWQVGKYFSTIGELLLSGALRNSSDSREDSSASYWLTYFKHQQQQCGVFVTPRRKLDFAAAARSYLRVFEEGGDASDVQAEAARGASRSVNTAGEERLVLLPRAHAPRAH